MIQYTTRGLAYYRKNATAEYKIKAVEMFEKSHESMTTFCKHHKIPRSTFQEWVPLVQSFKKGEISYIKCGPGQPETIPPSQIDSLKSLAIEGSKTRLSVHVEDFKLRVNELYQDGVKSRNGKASKPELSDKTVRNIVGKIAANIVTPQIKTTARITAESDPRNSYVMAVLCNALAKEKSPFSIFNWDATHYELQPNGDMKVIFVKDEETNDIPATVEGKSALPLTIKLLHLHCAGGIPAVPVFIVSDPNIGEEEYVAQKVLGLCNTIAAGSEGWLVFMKSRAGNAKFFSWYLQDIIIPFVKQCRDGYVENKEERAFVCCDGEYQQIEVLSTDASVAAMEEALIDMIKLPASCSGILQPSDVSNFFKASKKKLKSIKKDAAVADCAYLKNSLVKIFDERKGIDRDKPKRYSEGLIKITYSIKETLTADIIRDGYKKSGIYPLNIRQTMNQCISRISENEIQTMITQLPAMTDSFKLKGFLTEEEMDVAMIKKVVDIGRNTKPKDQRVVNQQRAVLLNSPQILTRFRDQLTKKLENRVKRNAATTSKKRKPNDSIAIQTSVSKETSLTNEKNEASSKKQKAIKDVLSMLQPSSIAEI